jgi:predicted MarR family transcription regulator
MPKNKSKRQGAKAIGDADDDFDKILAEVMANDVQLPADIAASTDTNANIASSSSSSSGGTPEVSSQEFQVSDMPIIDACRWGT